MVLKFDLSSHAPSTPPHPMAFLRYSPFNNTTGTMTTTLTDTSGMNQIKAGVISMSFKINAADASVATTNNFNLIFTSKILCVGSYSLYFYMPIASVPFSGDNYPRLTQSATIGSGFGIAIRHASTASECYCLYVNTNVADGINLDENIEYLIQAGINWNDLANSFIWINGAKVPATRLSTAQSVIAPALGISPFSFNTTTTTTMSLDITSFHCSAFSTVQGTTLANMCTELFDSSTGNLKLPSAYANQWQIALNNPSNMLVNQGTLGGTLAQTGSVIGVHNNPGIRHTYNAPSGQRCYMYQYASNKSSTDPIYWTTSATAFPSTTSLNDGFIVSIVYQNGTGTYPLTVRLVVTSTGGYVGTWNAYTLDCGSSNWTIYMLGNSTTGTNFTAPITANKTTLFLFRWGKTAGTGGNSWATYNKNAMTRTTGGAGSAAALNFGSDNYMTYSGSGDVGVYYHAYYSAEQITNNPQIPWNDTAAMNALFLKPDGQTIVDDPYMALGFAPLVARDPNRTHTGSIIINGSSANAPVIWDSGYNYTRRKIRATPLVIGQA